MILLVACSGDGILAITKDYEIKKIVNRGVVFEEIGTVQFYEKAFRVYTNVVIPSYDDKIRELEHYLDEFGKLCNTRLYDGLQCGVRKRQERRLLMEIKTKNSELMHLVEHQTRYSRGLMDGVGTVLKFVSGIMDANDAERINKKLSSLDESRKGLIEVQKDQLYAISSFRKNVNENLEQLFREQNVSRIHLTELLEDIRNHHYSDKTTTIEMRLTDMITSINLEFMELDRHQKETIEILRATSEKKLHSAIMAKEALSEIYNKMAETIQIGENQSMRMALSKCFTVSGEIKNQQLIVEIVAPMPEPTIYRVNRIYLLPIKIDPVSIYKINTPLIATNLAKTKFIDISEEEYKRCTSVGDTRNMRHVVCELTQPERSDDGITCEIQLILDKNVICELKVLPKIQPVFTRMTMRNKYLFDFNNNREIKILTRNGELITEHLNGTGILEVRNGAQFRMENYIYRTFKVENTNFTLEMPQRIDIDALYDPKVIRSSTHRDVNMPHQGMKITDGENFVKWENHIRGLEVQRELRTHTTVNYGISGVLGVIMVAVTITVFWEKIKSLFKHSNAAINTREINIELSQIPTHRMASTLNRSNTLG